MHNIEKLLQIMSDLRDPEKGCTWDIRQDFKSIAAYTVEEAYEVADAIEREDIDDLKDELGDLLFQVVFHAQMASEKSQFDFSDVVNEIIDKLVRRHPHVFAGARCDDEEQLKLQWEKHKTAERANKEQPGNGRIAKDKSHLDGITSSMPALRWSEKIQSRASQNGFDWDDVAEVLDKVDEEIAELKEEILLEDNQHRISEELGDVLFATVNLARHLGVNPEQSLRDSNRRFISRFKIVESLLDEDNKQMKDSSVESLLRYWQQAKKLARD